MRESINNNDDVSEEYAGNLKFVKSSGHQQSRPELPNIAPGARNVSSSVYAVGEGWGCTTYNADLKKNE